MDDYPCCERDSGNERQSYISPSECNRDKMRFESSEKWGQDWQSTFIGQFEY